MKYLRPYKGRFLKSYSKTLDVLSGLANNLPCTDMGNIPLFICNRPKSPANAIRHPRMAHIDSPIALGNATRLKESLRLARVPFMEYVTILIKKGFDKSGYAVDSTSH